MRGLRAERTGWTQPWRRLRNRGGALYHRRERYLPGGVGNRQIRGGGEMDNDVSFNTLLFV